ncbi:hypothetical protein B9Z65_8195 [Elsinoe australis]|uniref:Stress-response A/B barrel domain-containing protein n=1 Tax=Elsinoe australis TaxID=40998 RepID=A0A2P7YWA8_9PEZI|nr:hypothetical protein B9Z65_8195 [Elsinoe australis]
MTVVHVVLFEWKASASAETVNAACQRMLALKDKCTHPKTGQKYVKSYGGGRDNSPEGMQGGFTHGFVFEFENEADRDYYTKDDPIHQEFVGSIKDIIQNARVVDFSPGVL